MRKIIRILLFTMIVMNISIVNTIAEEVNEKIGVKSVRELWEYAYHNDDYEAPKEVEATFENGEKRKVKIQWNEEIPTNEIGYFTYEGKVKEFEKKVTLNLIVVPKIVSVKDINVSLYVGDEYSLPEKVEVKYSDGTIGMEEITWTTNLLDNKKVGEYDCEGKINGYDKVIKAHFKVESNFLISRTYPSENEKIEKLKFGYMHIVFSKDTVRCNEINKIILKDENGIRIKIKKAVPAASKYSKNYFIIVPSRALDSNMKYTLFVPKGLIKAVDGEVYEKDIEITFKTK